MKGRYIVWIVVSVIVIMSAAAFIKQSDTSSSVSPVIMENLIQPYAECLSSADYERAYFEYTSVDYKSKITLANYLSAQDTNIVKFGKLKELKPVSGVFLKETVQGNKIVFKATFAYLGEKGGQRIIVDAIKEDGKFKIFNTYNSYVSIGGLLPVIY
ncbi:MAG: hypothetical protein WC313_06475 [Candidatus Kapaibacterium sp.]|jgi:hypothetical protein|nr:hypothetical protein [Candidatus Kapabacteria bacterium]